MEEALVVQMDKMIRSEDISLIPPLSQAQEQVTKEVEREAMEGLSHRDLPQQADLTSVTAECPPCQH